MDPDLPAPPRGRLRPVDATVTIVLIVVLAAGGALSLVFGLFFAMASAGCQDAACTNRVEVAVLVIEAAPIVAWVPTTAWAVARMGSGRRAFWVPLLALPIWAVVVVAGLMLLPP